MIEVYLATLAGVAVAQASPGPNLLAVAGAAFGQGRRAAVLVAAGVATAIFLWIAAATFGLAALLAANPALLTAMKLLGGGYLLYLAGRALVAAIRSEAPPVQAAGSEMTALGAWRRGFLVNMTNPKSALMWTAVATFLFGSGLSAPEVLAFGPLGAASAFAIYGSYGVLLSAGAARRAYRRGARYVEALFGAAFGALGGKLFLDGLREVRP